MRFFPILVLLIGVTVALALSCVFIVDEREQKLVLEFGKVIRIEDKPGLKFKYPAPINTVQSLEDRILALETADLEVTPLDNRRLVVNAFARWRITDPKRFREAVQDEDAGKQLLQQILNTRLREVLGSVKSDTILSEQRGSLMRKIREGSRSQASAMGVEIVDVRIRRADLPDQNLKATYDRMKAERQQAAADQRARGREAAQVLKAKANREAVELVSQARKESEIVRGQADAERNRVYATAYQKDPEFFSFYRSLQAYEKSLRGDNSTMVLSPSSDFFRYLGTERDGGAANQ